MIRALMIIVVAACTSVPSQHDAAEAIADGLCARLVRCGDYAPRAQCVATYLRLICATGSIGSLDAGGTCSDDPIAHPAALDACVDAIDAMTCAPQDLPASCSGVITDGSR